MKRKITILASLVMMGIFTLHAQTVSTFEEIPLVPNSYWNGSSEPLGSSFYSGNASFTNYYDTTYGGYWSSGFAYSNIQDSTTAGMGNMYASMAGSGYNGSSNYIVGEVDAFNHINPKITLNSPATGKIVNGFFVTNATYSAISMRDGDMYGKKFGGATGNDPDWFKLTIRKWNNGALTNDSVDFYLADYRSSNNTEDYIVKDWRWVDISSLGNVDSLQFILSSTDVGTFGINTPLFFCIDNFTTADQGAGIKENVTSQISVYPNPATDILNINISKNEPVTITIIDITGRIVSQQAATGNIISMDLRNLTPGVYQLKVLGNSIHTNQTFIKR